MRPRYQNPPQSLRPIFSLRSALDRVGNDLLYLERPKTQDLRGFTGIIERDTAERAPVDASNYRMYQNASAYLQRKQRSLGDFAHRTTMLYSIQQPLRFEPYFRPMIWGGRRIARYLGKNLPTPDAYGESWEVSDHELHQS